MRCGICQGEVTGFEKKCPHCGNGITNETSVSYKELYEKESIEFPEKEDDEEVGSEKEVRGKEVREKGKTGKGAKRKKNQRLLGTILVVLALITAIVCLLEKRKESTPFFQLLYEKEEGIYQYDYNENKTSITEKLLSGNEYSLERGVVIEGGTEENFGESGRLTNQPPIQTLSSANKVFSIKEGTLYMKDLSSEYVVEVSKNVLYYSLLDQDIILYMTAEKRGLYVYDLNSSESLDVNNIKEVYINQAKDRILCKGEEYSFFDFRSGDRKPVLTFTASEFTMSSDFSTLIYLDEETLHVWEEQKGQESLEATEYVQILMLPGCDDFVASNLDDEMQIFYISSESVPVSLASLVTDTSYLSEESQDYDLEKLDKIYVYPERKKLYYWNGSSSVGVELECPEEIISQSSVKQAPLIVRCVIPGNSYQLKRMEEYDSTKLGDSILEDMAGFYKSNDSFEDRLSILGVEDGEVRIYHNIASQVDVAKLRKNYDYTYYDDFYRIEQLYEEYVSNLLSSTYGPNSNTLGLEDGPFEYDGKLKEFSLDMYQFVSELTEKYGYTTNDMMYRAYLQHKYLKERPVSYSINQNTRKILVQYYNYEEGMTLLTELSYGEGSKSYEDNILGLFGMPAELLDYIGEKQYLLLNLTDSESGEGPILQLICGNDQLTSDYVFGSFRTNQDHTKGYYLVQDGGANTLYELDDAGNAREIFCHVTSFQIQRDGSLIVLQEYNKDTRTGTLTRWANDKQKVIDTSVSRIVGEPLYLTGFVGFDAKY